MKKPITFILILLIILSLCAACADNNDVPDTPTPSLSPEEEMVDGNRLPAIMINGETYYCFGRKTDVVPSENQISGTIKSMHNPAADTRVIPSEDEQANFLACLDQPYAVKDGKVYLFWSNEWHVCTPAGEEVWENEVCYPMVMIDDALYYCFNDKADIVLSEDDISGTVSSVCSTGSNSYPIEDDQSNFTNCLNEPYAVIDGKVYLHLNGKWFICEVSTK